MRENPSIQPHHATAVHIADLPLHCPTAKNAVWNAHPRVYLPISEQGTARCPYCGTTYALQGVSSPSHHR